MHHKSWYFSTLHFNHVLILPAKLYWNSESITLQRVIKNGRKGFLFNMKTFFSIFWICSVIQISIYAHVNESISVFFQRKNLREKKDKSNAMLQYPLLYFKSWSQGSEDSWKSLVRALVLQVEVEQGHQHFARVFAENSLENFGQILTNLCTKLYSNSRIANIIFSKIGCFEILIIEFIMFWVYNSHISGKSKVFLRKKSDIRFIKPDVLLRDGHHNFPFSLSISNTHTHIVVPWFTTVIRSRITVVI